jgi:hypothetical protein
MPRVARIHCRFSCHSPVIRLSLVALASLIGCNSQLPPPVVQPPVVIVVRNNSGLDLLAVSLRGPTQPDGQANSYGTISPVPRGTTQILGRSTAFPLPGIADLVWTDEQDHRYTRQIALERLLRLVPTSGGRALVLEIRSAGELIAYAEDR